MANGNELLTVDEAAAKLRVNSDTVRRLMRQEKLPGVKVGGQWRISTSTLQEYLEKGTKPRTEPLPPVRSRKLAAKAATDPKWKNKTTGAKKI